MTSPFDYPFMVHALEAASIVAVLAGLTGWYMVLRRQAFAGHTLSVMAFPGAAGAAAAGVPAALGYYAACGAAALAIAAADPAGGRRLQSAAIGTIQAVGLAAGFLLLSLSGTVLSGYESLLFGTFYGVTSHQVLVLLAVAVFTVLATAGICRPLLFATIDRDVAQARGIPVRALDAAYLAILGLAVAATSQITGALLVFALLAAPPASAQLITTRPLASLLLSVALALASAWTGLVIAYYSPYPPGFYTTTVAFAIYVLARVARARKALKQR